MSEPSPPRNHRTLTQTEFAEVYERARYGDREATAALVLLFNDVLRNFFACRLRKFRKLQTRHDAEDLVQEVWASVLARDPAQRTWPAPAKWKSYLLGVAGRTFFVVARGECRQKCDVRRTVHGPLPEDSSGRVLAAGMPDPRQVREAEEAWLLLICQLPQTQQDIMALIRDGSTYTEAARGAGVSERTVRRVIDRLVGSRRESTAALLAAAAALGAHAASTLLSEPNRVQKCATCTVLTRVVKMLDAFAIHKDLACPDLCPIE